MFVAPVIYAPNTLTLPTPNLQYDMVARGDYTINDKNSLTVPWDVLESARNLVCVRYQLSGLRDLVATITIRMCPPPGRMF